MKVTAPINFGESCSYTFRFPCSFSWIRHQYMNFGHGVYNCLHKVIHYGNSTFSLP